jgi:hypothetical protein
MMSDPRFFDILASLEGARQSLLTPYDDGVTWARTLQIGPLVVSVEDEYEWRDFKTGRFTSSLLRAPMGISGSLNTQMIVHSEGNNSVWSLTGEYTVSLPLILRSYDTQIAHGLRNSLSLRRAASLAWGELNA